VLCAADRERGETSTLREALAKGADPGILLKRMHLGQRDTLGVGAAARGCVKSRGPDFNSDGLQSDDLGLWTDRRGVG